MLINLIKYEVVKRWKTLRYFFLGYILLQTLLLLISSAFFWNSNMAKVFTETSNNCQGIGTSSTLAMLLYFIMAILIVMFPFVESLYRFDRDLSGKQSALEFMIPVIAWKKIVSKLITVLCSTIICIGLGTLSIITFILLSSKFEKSIIDAILNVISNNLHSPTQFILGTLYTLLCFLSIYLISFFCIAFSKSFSHKNKIAVPFGMLTFVLIITALMSLNTLILRVPIITFTILGTEDSLSSLIVSLLVLSAALFGTSWLMENKVEQ